MRDEVTPKDVICKGGLELIFDISRDTACVNPSAAEKLIERDSCLFLWWNLLFIMRFASQFVQKMYASEWSHSREVSTNMDLTERKHKKMKHTAESI